MTFDVLYEEFEGRLRRYAMSLARDADRADDLVQETFIRVMGHLDLLGQLNRRQRRAWLFRTLKNLFIDEQRSRRRQGALIEQLASDARSATGPTPDAISDDVFALVPERDRELLRQRYELGMTSQEIARDLGIPAATVRSRLHLAIKRLRRQSSRFI